MLPLLELNGDGFISLEEFEELFIGWLLRDLLP